jgi:hypothetical protein
LGRHLAANGNHEKAADSFRRAIDAEAAMVHDVPRSLEHESPNPLYDDFISACQNSHRLDEIEPMLRQELATWHELEQRSAFSDTCQLRQLEIELRLAELLLMSNQLEGAAKQYRGLRSSLQDLLDQKQIKSKTIATCIHITSALHAADLPDCQERSQILEILRQHREQKEIRADSAEDENQPRLRPTRA